METQEHVVIMPDGSTIPWSQYIMDAEVKHATNNNASHLQRVTFNEAAQ